MTGFNPIAFYRELRRRRMFQVTLLYVASAWGIVGGCDLLFPQFPQWVGDADVGVRYVFIAAFAGFPVALIFGWLYDITADGIRRTAAFSETTQDPDTSLHALDRGIIGGLSFVTLAIISTLLVQVINIPPPATPTVVAAPEIPDNAIAVLPFTVCAEEDVDQLLAFGIANEVLRHLAQLPGLKVSARTAKFLKVTSRASAFAFAGADFEPQNISSVLRVRYLLTATVCKMADSLTIIAELVDKDGYLLWSDQYSQQTDAGGAITRTLAASVANGVGVELGAALPESELTALDRLAYEDMLLGREHRFRDDHEKARAALQRALQRQPDYAEAVYELALIEFPGMDDLDMSDKLENAKRLAEQALVMARANLETRPDSANAHFVVGRITEKLARVDEDLAWRRSEEPDHENLNARLAEAESHLRASLEINPSNSNAYFRLGNAVESQGRMREALAIFEAGRERDPFNWFLTARVVKRWAARGRFREAMGQLDRFRELPEMPSQIWWWMLELTTLQTYWDEKLDILIEMLQKDPSAFENDGNQWQAWWFANQLDALGLAQEAAQWRRPLQDQPIYKGADWHEEDWDQVLKRLASISDQEVLDVFPARGMDWALALAAKGEYDRAIRIMESIQFAPRAWTEREPWGRILLAGLYLQVGREDKAAALLASLAEDLEAEVNGGIRHPDTLHNLAMVYAAQGRDDAALTMVEMAVDHHFLSLTDSWLGDAFRDPWRNLRDHPRFKAQLDRTRDELHRQAARIREMLAQHDLDQLLAPLIRIAEREKQKKAATSTGQ